MNEMIIKSRFHDYAVEPHATLVEACAAASADRALYLADRRVVELYPGLLSEQVLATRAVLIDASEAAKSFEALAPIFLELLGRGLKRDGTLVVIGGGVAQDIGCFIASVLFRGLRWELIPTTLLAQADSCIGSKSSINIGPYKNQIGTFYPPHRVLLTSEVLKTLPWDEIRSGLGEVIKLQILNGEDGFSELMEDLANLSTRANVLSKWVHRSLDVKKIYIEADELDRGIRNLLNYGHTFGHAYESATHFEIPHGIAVLLGMQTATYLSARIGLVTPEYYASLRRQLEPWHQPYGCRLKNIPVEEIIKAIKQDKKNTAAGVNCILTRGAGRMEKARVSLEDLVAPGLSSFIQNEILPS